MSQPELFQELQPQQKSRQSLLSSFPGRFFRVRVAYEDVVFSALTLVLVLLAGFCVGVERGKRLNVASLPIRSAEGVASAGEGFPRGVPESADRSRTAKVVPSIQGWPPPAPAASTGLESLADSGGHYAIQLASYVGAQAAQAEVQRLSRRGIQAQVLRQGKFYELRAVGFRSRAEAEKSLVILRKTYRDAFVKRAS